MKAYKTKKGQAVPNHRKRKSKKVDNNIDLDAHKQTLKQQTTKWHESSNTYQY
jgi:hypothetical protein